MKKNSALWASTSVLVGVVIAVIALLHNTRWEFPLLVITVGVWLAWLGFTRALPAVRARRARSAAEQQRRQAAAAPSTAQLQMLLRMLLQHVNYRVSDCLKSAYPDARWEWCMRDPAGFVARGGTGRIRVYGIPDYSYADVTLGQNGKLDCSLEKVSPLNASAGPAPSPNQQQPDPKVWYETQGRNILENLVADLESRGHRSLTIKEDGSICAQPAGGGAEAKCAAFPTFPEKAIWPALVKVFEEYGLAATAKSDGIIVAW